MATIKDVARAANVSVATVSYVLNQSVPVSPATRERVLAAVELLAYRPNRLARNLQGRRTMTLALIASRLDAFEGDLAPLLYGCVAAASAAGYALLIHSVRSAQSVGDVLAQTVGAGLADGSIMLQPDHNALPQKGASPLVCAFAPPARSLVSCVLPDGVVAAERAVAALAHAGCRQIGLVLPPDVYADQSRWYWGYRRALRSAGLAFMPELVVVPEAASLTAGVAAAEALLAVACDGVLAAGSELAVGVARSLTRLPVVAGYDSSLVSGAGLSALVWPLQLWGQLLVEQLVQQLQSPATASRTYLEPQLIVRSDFL